MMSSLFDLTGKVAIVTGSTKGIGLAIASRMAEHGATVVVSSRKPDACEAVAKTIRDAGGKAIVIPCHRIVNKNGDLGGYGGGLRRKQYLLNLEQVGLGNFVGRAAGV